MNKEYESVTDKLAKREREDLLERVYHTDARVTAMESQMATVAGSVSRIESALVNKQASPSTLVTMIVGALTLMAAMVFGVFQMTVLSQQPIVNDVAEHRESINKLMEDDTEISYNMGRLREWQKYAEERINSIYSNVSDLDRRVRDNSEDGR
jgi:hypothetical protein